MAVKLLLQADEFETRTAFIGQAGFRNRYFVGGYDGSCTLMNTSLACRPGVARLRLAFCRHAAFTLVEVMVVMLLVMIMMVAGFGALYSMDLCSRRVADYTAATAVVEAKLQDIKAVYYNPPNYPFTAGPNPVYVTNSDSISLDQAGTSFKVSGTLVSEIKPVASGH